MTRNGPCFVDPEKLLSRAALERLVIDRKQGFPLADLIKHEALLAEVGGNHEYGLLLVRRVEDGYPIRSIAQPNARVELPTATPLGQQFLTP